MYVLSLYEMITVITLNLRRDGDIVKGLCKPASFHGDNRLCGTGAVAAVTRPLYEYLYDQPVKVVMLCDARRLPSYQISVVGTSPCLAVWLSLTHLLP